MKTRTGDFIRTFSGIKFWPIDPRPEEVNPKDIAHALSLKTRWQGQCNVFYSVAQHSLRVANVAKLLGLQRAVNPDELYNYGLLHDASEAFLPDVPTPVKPYIAEWKAIEGRVESAILESFQLPEMTSEIRKIVKEADRILLKIESQELFSGDFCKDWPSHTNILITDEIKECACSYKNTSFWIEEIMLEKMLEITHKRESYEDICLSST